MTQPDHGQLTDILSQEAAALFPHLEGRKVTLFAVGEGALPAVWWTLRGQHGGAPATPERPGGTFLGFHATGRQVTIDIVSILVGNTLGLPSDDDSDDDALAANLARAAFTGWRHSWDQLSALHQIGVTAVGRPVLR